MENPKYITVDDIYDSIDEESINEIPEEVKLNDTLSPDYSLEDLMDEEFVNGREAK